MADFRHEFEAPRIERTEGSWQLTLPNNTIHRGERLESLLEFARDLGYEQVHVVLPLEGSLGAESER